MFWSQKLFSFGEISEERAQFWEWFPNLALPAESTVYLYHDTAGIKRFTIGFGDLSLNKVLSEEIEHGSMHTLPGLLLFGESFLTTITSKSTFSIILAPKEVSSNHASADWR